MKIKNSKGPRTEPCGTPEITGKVDSVPHNSLLNKLHSLHVPNPILAWIKDYLSGRSQRVVLNGQSSSWLPISSGVPQGSILGPLLFLTYINDLAHCSFSTGSQLLMFADDLLLFKPITNASDYVAFQNDINAVSNWSKQNHLTLNVSKTKFMLISRSRQKSHPSLLLDSSPLEQVSHFKYLGVWISDDLTWTKHISAVTCKARRLLGFIFRTFSPFCSSDAIITLYKAQVLPILDYACIVWDPHLKKDSSLIENVQLFAARMATKSWRANASTLNETLNLPTITSRRKYFKVLYAFKFLNGYLYCPSGYFILRSNANLRVSHSMQLVQPFVKTSAFLNSYFITTVKLWNALPSTFVTTNSIYTFKNLIKSHYLT